MKRIDQKHYFLHPVEPLQRRYEALRAVVIDEKPMREVAEQFGISYGTIRNWRCEFQQAGKAGILPLFS